MRLLSVGRSARDFGWAMASRGARIVSHPDEAMKVLAYYNTINRIATDVAALSRNWYTTDGIQDKKLGYTDYAQVNYWKRMTSPGVTPSKMIKAWVMAYLKWGNGYVIIVRDAKTYEPMMYIHRRPADMYVFRDKTDDSIWYYDTKSQRIYAWIDVLHLAEIDDDEIIGRSKLTKALSHVVGSSMAKQDFINKYFENNLFLGAVIEYPVESPIDDDDANQIEQEMNKVYGGVDKTTGVGIITGGGKLKQLKTDIPLGDTNVIESEKVSAADIRAAYGVPNELKTEIDITTYYTQAIIPIVKMIEEEVNIKVPAYSVESHYLKFELDSILRADVTTRANVIEKYTNKGILTINEARALLDRGPVEGGDKPLVMANNMVPLDELEAFVASKISSPAPAATKPTE